MLLRVLGSGTCELRRERSSPAYLVEDEETAIMLDLGQGALRRLLQAGRDPARLTGALISHHHLDHLADLLPLLFALNYAPDMRERARITLAGHARLERVLEGLHGVFGDWLRPQHYNFAWRVLRPGREIRMGSFSVRAAAADHAESSLAFRLESGGASLVYLGDSRASDDLAELSRGADLVIAHCAGPDHDPRPGHMHPAAAGELAARAGVGALLISHLYSDVEPGPAVESAARAFGGPVWAAHDHMELLGGPSGFRPVQGD